MTTGPYDGDGIDAQVAEWALDDDAADAARVRSRSRGLVGRRQEDSSFCDVLGLAARRGTVVDVETAAGHAHLGRIEMVADDHIRLRTSRGVGLIAIGSLVQLSERHGSMSDLDPDLGPSSSPDEWRGAPRRLAHALERLTGTEVVLRLTVSPLDRGTERVGEIESVGEDYLVLRIDTGSRPQRIYARFEAVAEAWPFMSG